MQKRLRKLANDHKCVHSNDLAYYFDNEDKFGTAFIINMDTRDERLKTAKECLDKLKIHKYYRFRAIVGKELMTTPWHAQFNILRPGELGCLLSHLSIFALAAEHPNADNYTIIFEDDIVSSAESVKALFKELSEIDDQEKVDIIYLGKCLERCGQMTHIKNNIYRGVAPSCCHAYAIKNRYAKKILNDMDRCYDEDQAILTYDYYNRGIDSILGDYIINHMCNALVIHPAVFYQDVLSEGGSDLREKYMINYQECNDTNPPPEPEKIEIVRQPWYLWTALIISLVIILVILIIWQRKNIRRGWRCRATKWIALALLIIVLIVTITLIIIKLKNKSKDAKPEWLKGFVPPLQHKLPYLSNMTSRKPNHFIADKSKLASREYAMFNPNGFWMTKNRMITTMRVSNGKVSYPLLSKYDQSLALIDSRAVKIKSQHQMKSDKILGYEDMRLFKYKNGIYMIGVNLDRSPKNLPCMVLAELNLETFESHNVWHLSYEPLKEFPNKNWAPIVLPYHNEELGFIVDLDPLLIVKRKYNGYSQECEMVYSSSKMCGVEKVRNSTIVIGWNDVPGVFRACFSELTCQKSEGCERFFLLGHTKFVESDFLKGGWRVIYQHYFVVVDLMKDGTSKTTFSKPFYVESEDRPHIEYISGVCFKNDFIYIMYGIRDCECKYLIMTPEELMVLK